MAVTHNTGANGGKVAIGTAIKDAIEGGTGAGVLKLRTAADVTKATLTLATPCGTVNGTSGVLTFDCTPALSDATVASGTVTKALFETNAGADVMECAVGTSGSDINLSNNVFATNDAVQITSLTYTPPA